MIRFNRGGQPSWWVSLIPFVVLVAALSVVIYVFGTDALSGASQVALMFAAGITVTIAMVLYRIPWKTFEEAILDNITSVGTSIVILLLILNKKLLKEIDYMLLLTFVCFFIVSENLGQVNAVRVFLQDLLGRSTLLTSVGASQIISNVPAAVLLQLVHVWKSRSLKQETTTW